MRDKLTYTAVERTSDTVVTVTLPSSPDYLITANETVTVTIPASAITEGVEVVADPTFTITNETPPTSPRVTLGAALETAMGIGWQIYTSPPKTVAPPAIVIRPADPYQAPYHASGSVGSAWAFDVDLIVRYNLTEEGLYDLEVARETVSDALPDGWRWIEFGDIGEIEIAKKVYLRGTLGVAVAFTEGMT